MTHTTIHRLLLTAMICLPLVARPGLASDGTDPPASTQGEQAPAAPATQAEAAATVEADEVAAPAVTTDVAAPAVPGDIVIDDIDTTPKSDNSASQAAPIDMDRTGWPTVVVTPSDGSVTHNPSYMGNPPMGDDIVTPLHAPDPVWQIQEALAGEEAGNLNGENLAALGAQPFIGLAQFVIMPIRALFENPLSDATSP